MIVMIVDIHNHVLPGLDDGAQSMNDAVSLVRNAAENGVTHIIATPHRNDKFVNDAVSIKEAVINLNKEVSHQKISVEVLAGQEIHFYSYLDIERTGELLTLANSGKYILLELPDDHLPPFIFDILFQLLLKGYIPIIPHPERNIMLRSQKQKIFELITKGALIQISASSLLGKCGFAAKRYSLDLIKHNLAHFISSDAHHHSNRPFLIKQAYKYIDKKFTEKHVSYFKENAKHVLYGTDFSPMHPISFEKTRES